MWLDKDAAVSTIDVMVVYTPAAKQWADSSGGGISNVVSQSMEKAQLVADNSVADFSVNLVHSVEVSYTESGDSGTDLGRLQKVGDGYLDNVHTLRNTYGADVVVLFTKVEDTGGIGYLLNSTSGSPEYAFSITRVQQASWTFTTIHEIGHNMGLHHHKEQNVQPGPGLYSYSAGWRWTSTDSKPYCSVMTYEAGKYFSDGITHNRVAYFSNPSLTYIGAATGDAEDGDNARNVREIKTVIAAYRNASSYQIMSPTPGSTLTSTTPTFQWTAGAAGYWLYIGSSAGASNYYNSGSLGTATSKTVSGLPSNGSTVYVRFWYQATSGGGWASKDYTYTAVNTGSYSITSPTPGTILTSTTPTFQWTAGAAQYWLYIGSSSGSANYYNSGSLGTATSKTVSGLPSNGSTVYVRFWYQATSGGGWGYKDYTYTAYSSGGGGFNSQFNGSATNWLQDSGSWSIYGSVFYYTAGRVGYTNTSTYNQTYSSLDYSAKLWRNGDDSSSNRIIIRASGTIGSDGHFSNQYMFQYTRDGGFSVFKRVGGVSTAVKAWTDSSAIVQGAAWNTLRVKAVGSSFYFYINGTLVWAGTDSSLSSGRVGMGMYREDSSTGNGFWADYAVLTIPTSLSADNEQEMGGLDDYQDVIIPGNENGTFR
jgi:hypothetical protein